MADRLSYSTLKEGVRYRTGARLADALWQALGSLLRMVSYDRGAKVVPWVPLRSTLGDSSLFRKLLFHYPEPNRYLL